MAKENELELKRDKDEIVTGVSWVLKKGGSVIFTVPTVGPDDNVTVLQMYSCEDESVAYYEPRTLDADTWYQLLSNTRFNESVEELGDCLCWVFAENNDELAELRHQINSNAIWPDHEIVAANWPRLWELLKFALPGTLRERVFAPAYNDLLADHLESKLPKYQTTWARRWIQCCFALRTAGLVVECIAVGLRGAVAGMVVPVALREWIRNWWYGG